MPRLQKSVLPRFGMLFLGRFSKKNPRIESDGSQRLNFHHTSDDGCSHRSSHQAMGPCAALEDAGTNVRAFFATERQEGKCCEATCNAFSLPGEATLAHSIQPGPPFDNGLWIVAPELSTTKPLGRTLALFRMFPHSANG